MRPNYTQGEVFPIIVKILNDHFQHSTDYIKEPDIVNAMMKEEQLRAILGPLPKDHSASWWAHNMLAFFSKIITEDKTVPGLMKFKRRKIDGKWAYRVGSEGKSSTSASSLPELK